MISAYGDRQQHLLKLLLTTKAGLTVESLSQQLDISRNAVRQHLASLELEGLVAKGVTRPTGGRPEQSYVLTPKGHELFPRKYSWFSELLIESLRDETSPEHLRQRFIEMGKRVGAQLPGMTGGPAERIKQMTNVMRDLGYESTMRGGSSRRGRRSRPQIASFITSRAGFPMCASLISPCWNRSCNVPSCTRNAW
jgi:Predicted transcriptional regulator